MKSWHKEKKDLEEAIAIAGLVAAYNLIPKNMPVSEFPQRLIKYHEDQIFKELMEGVPSPAKEVRKARIDELKRR
ncbi:hypothetical protein ES702_06824 [subsurface metagenome]